MRENMECTFCKIIAGEMPAMKVYEDAYTLVFMDIAGDVDAHMLAVTKKHVESIFDCDEETLGHLMNAVKKVANRCLQCGYEGINLLNASGKSAGQSVGHFHIHIIPRKTGDEIDAWPPFSGAQRDITEVWNELKMKKAGL